MKDNFLFKEKGVGEWFVTKKKTSVQIFCQNKEKKTYITAT